MRGSNNIAIRVENLSKRYLMGRLGTGSLMREMEGWIAKGWNLASRGNKKGLQIEAEKSGYRMALDDVSFELPKGEILGIIGRNGAGKSTLLKLITKITAPTSGRIYINGRISSLLEVGTGFHPELTGRENIFMNGAVLGMSSSEVRNKLDQIIDFSGVSEYIDTPVKHYSSGMYTRLAFSVAAFLEPDILILDEVLAVGDAEFTRKSMAHMQEANLKEGKTVILVTHNLDYVTRIAKNSLHLEKGRLKDFGRTEDVVMRYKDELQLADSGYAKYRNAGSPWLELSKLKLTELDGSKVIRRVEAGSGFRLRLIFDVKHSFEGDISLFIQTSSFHPIFDLRHSDTGRLVQFSEGINVVDLLIEKPLLLHGKYLVTIMVTDPARRDVYEHLVHMPGISVIGTKADSGFPPDTDPRMAQIYVPMAWHHQVRQRTETNDLPNP